MEGPVMLLGNKTKEKSQVSPSQCREFFFSVRKEQLIPTPYLNATNTIYNLRHQFDAASLMRHVWNGDAENSGPHIQFPTCKAWWAHRSVTANPMGSRSEDISQSLQKTTFFHERHNQREREREKKKKKTIITPAVRYRNSINGSCKGKVTQLLVMSSWGGPSQDHIGTVRADWNASIGRTSKLRKSSKGKKSLGI